MCIYDVYALCSCPHGRCFTVLAQCFTIASWVCSVIAVTSCFYMYVRPIPEEGEPELPREGFGYMSRQIKYKEPPQYSQCVFWEKEDKEQYFESDSMWRAGKAMSLLAVIVGFVVMCIMLCTCCVAFQLRTFEGLFWVCIFCFIAQALTFLAWGSDLCDEYECTWSGGTGMNITAAMLWIWAANMIKSFPEALAPRSRGRKKPLYDIDEQDDDPNNRVYGDDEDEYDYDEGNFANDDDYYDDGDDDDDDYNRGGQYYDDQEGYEDQDYDDDNEDYSKYDPDNNNNNDNNGRRQQGGRGGRRGDGDDDDDDDDPNSSSYFDRTTDDQSQFSRKNQTKRQDDNENSFRGID